MKPARPVVTRSPSRTVGIVNAGGVHMGSIAWESKSPEREFVHLCLLLPELVRIEHQPFRVPYKDGGVDRYHVPDFRVTLRGGVQVIAELKPEVFVPKHRVKFDAVSEVLAASGLPYYVLTEEHVDPDRAAAAKRLLRFARYPYPADLTAPAAKRVADSPEGLRLQRLLEEGVPVEVVFHLIGRRVLVGPADLNPQNESVIRYNEVVESDGTLCFDDWFACSPWRAHMAASATP